MDKNFGKLEKVDLRKLWSGEASEFTPWLAMEENIAELSETIGMELEVQEQEKGSWHIPGRYSMQGHH